MSLLGQCPVCRSTVALPKASGDGARGRRVNCERCGTALEAQSLDSVTEIPANCENCGSRYVVDKDAAGEQLPCCCGAAVTIPSTILVAIEVSELCAEAVEETRSDFDEVDEAEIERVAAEADSQDAIDVDATDPVDLDAVDVGEEADVTALSESEEFEDSHDNESDSGDVNHTSAADLDAGVVTLRADEITLPITREPELYSIEVPETPPVSELDAVTEELLVEEDHTPRRLSLPITREPELYLIEVPETPPINELEAVAEELLVKEDHTPRRPLLPIAREPELYSIEVPETSPVNELEAVAEELLVKEDRTPRRHSLPITREPELYSIEVPETPPVNELEAVAEELLVEDDRTPRRLSLPITRQPELYRIGQRLESEPLASASLAGECQTHAESNECLSDAIDPSGNVQDEPNGMAEVACPGCKKHYRIAVQELGQTAECECGFVFVMKDNVDAIDSAFLTDLIPYPPLVLDRTGERTEMNEQDTAPDDAAAENESSVRSVHRVKRSSIPMLGRLSVVSSVFALVIGSAILLALYGVIGDGGDENPAPEFPHRPASPIPVDDLALLEQPLESTQVTSVVALPNQPDQPASDPSGSTVAGPAETDASEFERNTLSAFLAPIRSTASAFSAQPTLDRKQLHEFADALGDLGDRQSELTVNDLFWIAETWELFAVRASTQELASRCYWQAAAAFALAQTVRGISVDDRQIAVQRQKELSERSVATLRLAAEATKQLD